MPHQCLKCGRIFEEGSSQLLKGCPDCNGNRFFFTKEPLDEKERNSITEELGQNINTVITDLINKNNNNNIFDKSGNWLNIKPKDVRKAFQHHLPNKTKNNNKSSEEKKDILQITDDKYRVEKIEKLKKKESQSNTPETIDIEKPGKYKIDVKGLLEEEPIIIQKDGSYTIHLPSLFKMINKE
jgi:predicted  nucleic acid-binding Zn-ribbon protein